MTNSCLNSSNNAQCINAGMRLNAVVKAVCTEGVYVQLPGGSDSGLVSSRCWGKGEARQRALKQIKVGDVLDVSVKSYDARTKSAALVLAHPVRNERNIRRPQRIAKRAVPPTARPVGRPANRKPDYTPLPIGTTLLIDTANLIALIGPEQASYKLEVISDTLSIRGYSGIFLWERRAFDWTAAQQANKAERSDLAAFAQRENVSLVGGEADLVLLQAAHEIAGSVVVTRDMLRDYAAVYPDLVATERHRAFSSVKLVDRLIVSIAGLRDAITIAERVVAQPCETPEAVVAEIGYPQQEAPERRGLLAVADRCRVRGRTEEARLLYTKAARKNPSAFYDLADLCNGSNGEDARKAVRYLKLANRRAKMYREMKRRAKRLCAEHRREIANGWLCAA